MARGGSSKYLAQAQSDTSVEYNECISAEE